MAGELVAVEVDAALGVAVVRLDNPPVNAMEEALLARLGEAFERIEAEEEIRAVVLTGTGDKAFAAGANLPELLEIMDDPDAIASHTALTRDVLGRIAACRRPVVAALQASAVGGGFELALSCDFVIADPRARVGLPEVGLGLIPGAGGTQRLARRIGAAAATEMILTGRLLKAPDALARGAVGAVAEPGEALVEARELAARLAAQPALAVEAAKRAIRLGGELSLEAGLDVERGLFTEILASADAREGVEAFISRREPRFGHR
jgi:enoyl-CoA hydratase